VWFVEQGGDALGRRTPPARTMTPSSGPATGGTAVTVAGFGFADGATVSIGGVGAGNVSVSSPTRLAATVPAVTPGALEDLRVTRPDGSFSIGPSAWFADFQDVPQADIFHDFVETIFRRGITAGCGGGSYC